ncbi:right-handed parallel beta-helix repeat-containing protein [Streptomyces sp. NPDC090127]|uniref:right-handed parallel beta-helix repeat-containing protein n=1 Tax=Streptomyces sp. NPDC090127 TaxID=3365953 RepID=UPI003826B112
MVVRYVVSPHGARNTYPNITSALRAWSALRATSRRRRSGLVVIAPGRYDESLVARGDLRLVAAEGPGSVVVSRLRGTVLETYGTVAVEGLVLTGRDVDQDIVACAEGTLTLDHVEVRTPGGVGTHARPNTHVILRDSVLLHGRTLFTASQGTIERCRFVDAADNAVAAIEGAQVAVGHSRIEGSRIHGVRVCDARATVAGCELTGTGSAALMADTRATLVVADCVITDVHAEGIMFVEQSRGSVDRTHVTDARHGVGAASGADPVVRDSTFTACRDTGINVQTDARGRYEDCRIVGAGNIGVFSTKGGAPAVHRCRVSGGNVGIAVTQGARGLFTGLTIEDLTNSALRVFDPESKAVFEDVRVDRCAAGLEVRGDGGTTAELTRAEFRDVEHASVALAGQSRTTLRNLTAHGGVLGLGVGEEAQLRAFDTRITGVSSGGAVAFGSAKLIARNLTVTGSGSLGLCGRNSAFLDVTHGEFTDCAGVGAAFDDECSGRLVDSSVSGAGELGVRHNGLVDLTSLTTSLRLVRNREPVPLPPTIINIFNNAVFTGPHITGPVTHSQFAWNNQQVTQNQTNEDGAER